MAPKPVLGRTQESAPVPVRMRLFKVKFTRPPRDREVTNRVCTFITFGTSEADAVNRVWDAYAGTQFQTDWDRDTARAEFQMGDVLRIGG